LVKIRCVLPTSRSLPSRRSRRKPPVAYQEQASCWTLEPPCPALPCPSPDAAPSRPSCQQTSVERRLANPSANTLRVSHVARGARRKLDQAPAPMPIPPRSTARAGAARRRKRFEGSRGFTNDLVMRGGSPPRRRPLHGHPPERSHVPHHSVRARG